MQRWSRDRGNVLTFSVLGEELLWLLLIPLLLLLLLLLLWPLLVLCGLTLYGFMCRCCIMACSLSFSLDSCSSSWETTCIWTRACAVLLSSSWCSWCKCLKFNQTPCYESLAIYHPITVEFYQIKPVVFTHTVFCGTPWSRNTALGVLRIKVCIRKKK